MDDFRKLFPLPATLFVVVHAETPQQALRNTVKAVDAAADGIFLINHSISDTELVECYEFVRKAYPDRWIGLSFRGRPALESLAQVPDSASGLWTGDAGIREGEAEPPALAREFCDQRRRRKWRGLHFGGVAFKYHEQVKDPAAAALAAAPYVDVVTTSGEGTGIAAPVAKIRAMKQAIGTHPLAIASGIAADNVHLYKGVADCFLVASSVSDSHSELNVERIAALAGALRS
jgi:uncharacterized protein